MRAPDTPSAADAARLLTGREHWETSYADAKFVAYPLANEHFDLLFAHADRGRIASALEIGSYPGPFLAALGACGYELNGVDFHPGNAAALPDWLRSLGHDVGSFKSVDFHDYHPGRTFDLVYSLGFIEHFEDFREVIARHARLVSDGGYLFLTTPNFRGTIQRWLHRALDRQNLERHHLPAMDPGAWAEVMRPLGFEILFCGHFGHIAFWVDANDPRSAAQLWLARAVARVFRAIRKVYRGDSRHFSPHCALVARRRVPR